VLRGVAPAGRAATVRRGAEADPGSRLRRAHRSQLR
jgi:hypothetical protein